MAGSTPDPGDPHVAPAAVTNALPTRNPVHYRTAQGHHLQSARDYGNLTLHAVISVLVHILSNLVYWFNVLHMITSDFV